MNKKSITLRLDITSKFILLILGAGVWFMALKPVVTPEAHAEINPKVSKLLKPDDKKEAYLSELCATTDSINRLLIKLLDVRSDMPDLKIELMSISTSVRSINDKIESIDRWNRISGWFGSTNDRNNKTEFDSQINYDMPRPQWNPAQQNKSKKTTPENSD